MEEHLLAIVGSGFVLILVADLIGNNITFSNRIYNALTTAIIWGILFFFLNWVYGQYNPPPLLSWEHLWQYGSIAVVLAFIADLIGNTIAFRSRYRNAITTAIVWAVFFYGIAVWLLHYWTGRWIFI
jgi:ABC-type Fe3+-siderophore transport system permease subunit